jgi:hypothetical protein
VTTFIRLASSPYIDGQAAVAREWHDLSGIERLDLLQDWIGLLNEIYDSEKHAQNGSPYKPNETCLKAIKYQRRARG